MSIDGVVNEALKAARAQISAELSVFFGPIQIVVMLVALVFGMVSYCLHSAGLYSVAKRRGRSGAWLSWLPVGRTWMLGEISDNYQYVRKEKIQGWDMLLVKLEMVRFGLEALWCLMLEAFVTNVLTAQILVELRKEVEHQIWLYHNNVDKARAWKDVLETVAAREEAAQSSVITPLIVAVLIIVAILVIQVFFYKAYYDLFASCRPDLKVVFLVLGILFPVTLPFFVFSCRKHDLGMENTENAATENTAAVDGQVFLHDT